MSIARQLLHEFRPFFRMLDEPLTRAPVTFARSRSLFDDPFFSMNRGPAVDVSEQGNKYVVEAEMPGVKKENVEVRIGDGGRSLTFEGKILAATEGSENNVPVSQGMSGLLFPSVVAETFAGESTQISTERSVIGNFSRTVILPRPVDSDNVVARLEDGILRVTLAKAEDKGSVSVMVE
jgi:HSP20 family molecular chaperone IbpA